VPRMFANDQLPDCTAAGLANGALAVSALAGYEMAIDDAKVPLFYASVVGCQPTEEAMAATDGAVILDVLQRQATGGFDAGGQTPLVALAGTLQLNRIALAQAMASLGIAYLGVDLFERDMEMPDVWDDDGRDPGALVGGHCLDSFDYTGLADDRKVRLATWGRMQPATWRWLDSRVREAHGLLWRQIRGCDGVDLAALGAV
jgi:hypothetical protein